VTAGGWLEGKIVCVASGFGTRLLGSAALVPASWFPIPGMRLARCARLVSVSRALDQVEVEVDRSIAAVDGAVDIWLESTVV
jgi:hypothetical protein